MGGKSKSSTASSNTTTNTQQIQTTTVGLEDVQNSNVALGNQTINQTTTDFGAVRAGAELGEAAIEGVVDANDRALDFGDDALESSFDFATQQSEMANKTVNTTVERAFDFSADNLKSSFDFGEEALNVAERGLQGAQDLSEVAIDRSLDFGSEALDDSFAFGKAQTDSANAVVRESVSTLGRAIDQAAAASRTDSTQSFQKIILYVSIAAGVAAVAFAFRRG